MIWFAVYTAVIGEIEEDDGVGKPIPKKLTNLLDKFEDRMPNDFPKILPPRRIVDHWNELDPEAQPSARAPYQLPDPSWKNWRGS